VIFLDETEGLVRIYDREWQCHAEENNRTPTASGVINPFSAELPSLEAFGVSASPGPCIRPQPQSPSSAIDHPVSTHKRRKTAESSDQPGTSIPGSPGQRSTFLPHYSPTASHHSASFATSPASVGQVPASTLTGDHSSTFGSRQQANLELVDIGPSYAIASQVQSPTYLELPAWPLTDVREARLMRYFVDRLSTWVSPIAQTIDGIGILPPIRSLHAADSSAPRSQFDLCDPERHFALIVPQRAALCPTLLNAVFAVSARHLNRISNYDPYAADRYYNKCLNHLQAVVYDTEAILDENLLAATVILRFLEEVDGKSSLVAWHTPLILAFPS